MKLYEYIKKVKDKEKNEEFSLPSGFSEPSESSESSELFESIEVSESIKSSQSEELPQIQEGLEVKKSKVQKNKLRFRYVFAKIFNNIVFFIIGLLGLGITGINISFLKYIKSVKIEKPKIFFKIPFNGNKKPLTSKEIENLLKEADIALQQKNFIKAENLLKNYLSIQNDKEIMNDLGAILIIRRRCEDALKLFEELAKDKKDDVEIKLNLVLALICNKKLEEAKEEIKSISLKDLKGYSRELYKNLKNFLFE